MRTMGDVKGSLGISEADASHKMVPDFSFFLCIYFFGGGRES